MWCVVGDREGLDGWAMVKEAGSDVRDGGWLCPQGLSARDRTSDFHLGGMRRH